MHFCHKRLTVHPVNTDRQQREELTAEMASLLVINRHTDPTLALHSECLCVCPLKRVSLSSTGFRTDRQERGHSAWTAKQASKQRSARSIVSCTHGSNIKLAPERCVAYFCRVQASKSPVLTEVYMSDLSHAKTPMCDNAKSLLANMCELKQTRQCVL